MNVAQETLGFRRGGLSPPLSLLMSAFALPIPPAGLTPHLRRPTERSSTIQESEVRNQGSATTLISKAVTEPLQHLGDLFVLVAPMLPLLFVKVVQVKTVS
jgi:hypothetical protein